MQEEEEEEEASSRVCSSKLALAPLGLLGNSTNVNCCSIDSECVG